MDFENKNSTGNGQQDAPLQEEHHTAKVLEMPARFAQPEQRAQPDQPVRDGVRAYDQDGNEIVVPRAEWAANVLPGMVEQASNDPDQLYLVLLNSLNEGFFAEMTDAAERLYQTDTNPARGASIWAIVLMQTGRLDEAEQVLTGYGEHHPADGSVLLNLAKVYSEKGDTERAAATLRQSLEIDPNLDNAVGWYTAQASERGGESAAREALKELAALPGSWRAQLWLARGEMAQSNFGTARSFYEESLERAPRPVPAELLMQMSGDLGSAGRLVDLVELTRPHFVPEVHGLPVAGNLIKALADLGALDLALSIKRSLDPFNRPDWREALAFWETELERRRTAAAQQNGVQIGMLRIDGAVWLPPGSPARTLFGVKPEGQVVTFLGGSAESPEQTEGDAPPQLAEALGRMTRSLPLYLAEQVEMRTAAAGRALLPWATGAASGFVVSGARWPDETAMQAIQDPANRSDYVVTVHVDGEVEPWTVDLTFLRASDGTRIGELSAEFDSGSPETALPKLADEVVELLSALGPNPTPAAYVVPAGRSFERYLLHLEQLMATRCAGIEGVPEQFLSGERAILSSNLELSSELPDNVPARLLLIETLGAMQRVRPQAVAEFGGPFQKLVEEKPLPELDRAFGGA